MYYYDSILVLIPVFSISFPSALATGGVQTPLAIIAGFLPTVLLVGYSLFVHPPTNADVTEPDRTDPHLPKPRK